MNKFNLIVPTATCNEITFEARALLNNQDPVYAWHNVDIIRNFARDIPQQRNNSVNSYQASANRTSYPRLIMVYYTTADETTYTSELLIDLPTFISSIGGNLGLFLGFSFIGILFPLYEWIEQQLLRRNPNTNPTIIDEAKDGADN